jgi:hypothetical protein
LANIFKTLEQATKNGRDQNSEDLIQTLLSLSGLYKGGRKRCSMVAQLRGKKDEEEKRNMKR